MICALLPSVSARVMKCGVAVAVKVVSKNSVSFVLSTVSVAVVVSVPFDVVPTFRVAVEPVICVLIMYSSPTTRSPTDCVTTAEDSSNVFFFWQS